MPEDQELEPTGGVPGEAAPKPTESEQSILNRLDKRHRKELQEAKREAEKLRAQLQEIEDQKKTEQEKAIDAAAKKAAAERDQHWTAEMSRQQMRAAISMAAVKHGIHQDFIPAVLAKLPDDVSPETVSEAVESIVKENPHFAPSKVDQLVFQTGTPSNTTRSTWTAERLQRELAQNPNKKFSPEEWQQIKGMMQ